MLPKSEWFLSEALCCSPVVVVRVADVSVPLHGVAGVGLMAMVAAIVKKPLQS